MITKTPRCSSKQSLESLTEVFLTDEPNTNEKKTATKHQFITLLAREEKNKAVFSAIFLNTSTCRSGWFHFVHFDLTKTRAILVETSSLTKSVLVLSWCWGRGIGYFFVWVPIFDPTLVQYFIQIPGIIFRCPLSAYDKWWFEQKKSPHFREKYLVLSYLNYALHQKYISLNTAGQNKCLFCRNPHLGILTSLWYWCKSTLITWSLKEKRKRRLLQAHAIAKPAGWVLSWKLRHYCTDRCIKSYAHFDSCARPKKRQPCHATPTWNFVVEENTLVPTDR